MQSCIGILPRYGFTRAASVSFNRRYETVLICVVIQQKTLQYWVCIVCVSSCVRTSVDLMNWAWQWNMSICLILKPIANNDLFNGFNFQKSLGGSDQVTACSHYNSLADIAILCGQWLTTACHQSATLYVVAGYHRNKSDSNPAEVSHGKQYNIPYTTTSLKNTAVLRLNYLGLKLLVLKFKKKKKQ